MKETKMTILSGLIIVYSLPIAIGIFIVGLLKWAFDKLFAVNHYPELSINDYTVSLTVETLLVISTKNKIFFSTLIYVDTFLLLFLAQLQ